MASARCDVCGAGKGVAAYKLTGPVRSVDINLCEKDSGPIRYVMGHGRDLPGAGTAIGPRVLDFLPTEEALVANGESPPPAAGGFDGNGLFSEGR
jgi:hypothetical protein